MIITIYRVCFPECQPFFTLSKDDAVGMARTVPDTKIFYREIDAGEFGELALNGAKLEYIYTRASKPKKED